MSKTSVYTIASIWAVALIATAIVLKGTPQSKLVIDILSTVFWQPASSWVLLAEG